MTGRAMLIAAALLAAAPCFAQDSPPPDSTRTPPAPAAATPPSMQPGQVIQTPPDFPRGRISGYFFGDYYYNATGDPNHHYNATGSDSDKVNIDGSSSRQIGKDLNGVQIRRLYFQLDNDLSIRVSTRFRLEVDSKSLTSDGKLGVNVKAAYAQFRSVVPRGDFSIGVLTTPMWDAAEEFWQYRSIEKTIADFRGLGTSADIGAALRGFVDPDHRLGYWAMVGNGTGQKPEDNRYKKVYLNLPVRVGDLRLDPAADYENGAGGADRATYRVFAGYELRKLAVGLEVVDRVNHLPAGNQEPQGFSVFARSAVTPTVAGFARFDAWKPDRRAANRVDQQLWIAGVDWQPVRDVHLMPNIEALQYDAKGTAVAPTHNELQARLTVYVRFSRPQS